MNIKAQEKYLALDGHPSDAYRLVMNLRETYNHAGKDMPKVLNDFVFNIEVALQDIGFLDENFNLIGGQA